MELRLVEFCGDARLGDWRRLKDHDEANAPTVLPAVLPDTSVQLLTRHYYAINRDGVFDELI